MTRILIVEDDPEVLSLLQYTLSKEKFKVYTAENGKKALELLDTAGLRVPADEFVKCVERRE